MERDKLEKIARMIASVLTDEELKALIKRLEDIRKWESRIYTSENPGSMNG